VNDYARTKTFVCYSVLVLAVTPEAERVEAFKTATCDKLRSVRCPVHRQAPRIRFEGTCLRDISVNLSGCCDRLLELANRAIGNRA
jgi:hypothetical protein